MTIEKKKTTWVWYFLIALVMILVAIFLSSCGEVAFADTLTASWYSVQSLKEEGTWKHSKGVMANGKQFNEQALTAASCDFPLGTRVRVTSIKTKQSVVVKVTDRCNVRFRGERIDLSKGAFSKISSLERGLEKVSVEVI